jgi:hypothetical protein
MKIIDYEKRKNKELFADFKKLNTLNIGKIQNYIPIYSVFFNFKDNLNINLNHTNYLTSIRDNDSLPDNDNEELFAEKIFNITCNGGETRKSFLKLCPVFDMAKFLVGKYDMKDEIYYILPTNEETAHKDVTLAQDLKILSTILTEYQLV